jgi:hypothetical protein
MMRPTYSIMAFALFIQTNAFFILVSLYISGIKLYPLLLVHLIPGITACITLLLYRRWIGKIWDVSIIIRPLHEFNPKAKNVVLELAMKLANFFDVGENDESDD